MKDLFRGREKTSKEKGRSVKLEKSTERSDSSSKGHKREKSRTLRDLEKDYGSQGKVLLTPDFKRELKQRTENIAILKLESDTLDDLRAAPLPTSPSRGA